MTTGPCPKCGGSAPRGFLFCIACAMQLTDDDPSGGLLYTALWEERRHLEDKINDGRAILAALEVGQKKERAEAMLDLWAKQLAAVIWVMKRMESAAETKATVTV
jgi:hypothetical protein